MKAIQAESICEFGEFRLDTEKKILWRGDAVVSLPLKSIELLCVLIENSGAVVGKDELLERVWKNSFVEESVLTQNIYLLRKTLQTKSDGKHLIKNIPRRGYLFGGEVRRTLPKPPVSAGGLTSLRTIGAETILERHLFERIEYEEINGGRNFVVGETAVPLEGKKRTSARVYQLAFVGILLAVAAAVSAAFFLRSSSRQTVAVSPSVIKLKSLASSSSVKRLVVLPLRIADEKENAFAVSFANDLSVRLGSLNKFTVVPFALVQEGGEVNAELKADYILDGEVSAANGLYAAGLRLLDTKTNAEVWTAKFSDADLVRLEDAISNKTAQAVISRFSAKEKETIAKRLPTNLAAYENFQTGYALWRRREDGQRKAYFKRAIESDASFARAYVALAGAEAMQGTTAAAEEYLKQAFKLDDNSADAYAVQGFIRIFHYRDWKGAETSLQTALALDANNVNAHHWLAGYYLIHRRLDDAKTEMQAALELDPTNPTLLGDMGQIYCFAGEKDAAIEYCRRAIAFDPKHPFANQYLDRIIQPQEITDKKEILNRLTDAADRNDFALPYINADPLYEDLRDEPQFQNILRKLNL